MSNQVDNRIVSMEFDNSRFERNVQTSMSTLDKLKQKLNLSGAAKGLDEVDKASKRVDMSGISKGVETVHASFSALEVMGITALSNLTNKAVDAGLKIAKALTIDPITTGLSEYETKLNSIQVIKSNTRDKYTDENGITDEVKQMADIEKALSDLNDYADRTIYNYTQMTSNVGKFVAQGLGVDEATKAVQGLANLAGASGASAEDMARATYQMSQALGGTIRKMDWNSLRNANMATVQLKNTLMDVARAEGLDIDAMIKAKGNFEETLEQGWLTGDMFTKAMNIYSDAYSEAELKAMGFNEKQIANFKSLAKEAAEATTEVKTMSQLWDVLKETAQSGWTQTWEILFGGFGDAKKMFTDLQNYFSGIINAFSYARNFVLEIAFNFEKIWSGIENKLNKAGLGKIKDLVDGLKDLKYWQDIVNKVWRGDYNNYGDNPDRFEWLEKDGYNHKVVQDLVNLGYKHKITMEEVEASHKKFGLTMTNTASSTKKTTNTVNSLTNAQLKKAELTDDEIALYRALEKEAGKLGITLDELVKKMSEQDGRSLLIESFKNLWSAVEGIFKALKQAFNEIFNPPGLAELGVKLYGLIARFKEFTDSLRLTNKEDGKLNDNGKKLVRTFKGIFAIVDIVATLIGGPLKIAFKIISKILEHFNLNILDVTAVIGDALVTFHDWIDSILDFGAIFEWLLPYLRQARDAIVDWYEATKPFDGIGEWFKNAFEGVKAWVEHLKTVDDVPKYIFEGLINGFKAGIKAVGTVIGNIARYIIDVFCNIFGIHSPSVVFFTLGGFIIAGLLLGIKQFAPDVWKELAAIGDKCIEVLKNVDFGGVLTAAIAALGSYGFVKMSDSVASIAEAVEGLGDFLEGVGIGIKRMCTGIGKYFKAKAWESRSKALLNFAIAIGVLAASIYILAQIDPGRLWGAIGALIVLSAVLIGFTYVVSKLNSMGGMDISKEGISIKKTATQLIPIAAALLLVGMAVKQLGGMELGELIKGGIAIVVLAGVMLGIMKLGQMIGPGTEKLGGTLIKIAIAIGVLALVARMIGGMDPEALFTGMIFMSAFVVFIGALTLITRLGGKGLDKLGSTLIKMAIAIGILALVARIIGGMDPSKLAVGLFAIKELTKIILALVVITAIAGRFGTGKIGSTLLGISAAMLVMSLVIKIVGGMEAGVLKQGLIVMGIFTAIITKLIAAVALLGGGKVGKIGLTVLSFALSMAILAAVVSLLGMMKVSSLAKGLIAVTVLGFIVSGLIKATKDVRNCHKNLLMMAIVIGVMALAVGLLSFIPADRLAVATAAITAITGMLTLLIKSMTGLKSIKGAQNEIMINLGLIAAIMVVCTLLITHLAQMPVENVLGAALGLSALILALSGALIAVSYAGKFANGSKKGIIALTAMVIPLAVFAAALAFMPQIPGHVAGQLPMLGIVIGAMTAILFPLSLVGKMGIGSVMTGVLALTSMMVPLCTLIAALAFMPAFPAHVADQLPAIGIALGALTLLLFPLALIGKIGVASAMSGILALTFMAVPLWLMMEVLAGMPAFPSHVATQLQNLLPVLTVMTLLLIPLTLIGIFGPAAYVGIGALSTLIVAIGGLATLCGALGDGFQSLLEKGLPMLVMIAGAIGEMIGAFVGGIAVGLCNALPPIGQALSDFMTNANVFIKGCKAVNSEVLAGASTLALVILELTAAAFLSGVSSLLPTSSGLAALGSSLSDFMDEASGFFKGLEQVTPDMSSAAKNLASLILALSTADLLEGIKSLFGLEGGLDTFGEKLAGFGESIKIFLDSVSDLTEDDLKKADIAAQAGVKMAEMANKIPGKGGILQDIAGESDLQEFASSIIAYGEALMAFGNTVSTITPEQAKKIESATSAGSALSDLANEIPKAGGVLQDILGAQDLADFGVKAVEFGRSIVKYAAVVKDITKDDATKIKQSAEAGKALAGLEEALPTSGGWWQAIAGSKDVGTFGEQIVKFAQGLKDYIEVAKTIDPDKDTVSIDNTKKVIEKLKEVAELVPESGGWWAGITGSKDAGGFGEAIKMLAEGISTYVAAASKITEDTIKQIKYSKNAITAIKEVAAAIPENYDGADNISSFMLTMKNMVNSINEYVNTALNITTDSVTAINNSKSAAEAIKAVGDAFNGVDTAKLDKATKSITSLENTLSGLTLKNFTGVDKFKEAVTSMSSVDGKKFQEAMSSLSTTSLDNFIKTLTDGATKAGDAGKGLMNSVIKGIKSGISTLSETMGTVKTTITDMESAFTTAGTSIMNAFKKGILDKSPDIVTTVISITSSCVAKLIFQYSNFYMAGVFVATGFANGIKNNKKLATDAGSALGKAALKAAKEALDENSPSKEMYEVGDYAGIGFVNALYDNVAYAYKAGTEFANSAKSGISNAVAKIADVINSDIDAQPTIRPVLDLSDVSAGAGTINKMFGINPTVGVLSRTGSISTLMNERQNGNGDIVSAIKDLKKTIGNKSGDTYTFGNVTYGDDSAVSDAVGALVQAIRVGGRA